MVCKPWHNRELLKLVDTPRLIGFELGPMLGLKRNLTLTGVYNDCHKNMSLWSMLQLNELMNLDEQLNMSQYTDVILTNIHITPIILLSHVESQINKLHNVTKDLNFTRFTQQVNTIHSMDLTEMATQIKNLELPVPKFEEGINNLLNANNYVKYIKRWFLNYLNLTTENLQSNVKEIHGKVSKVFGIMGIAQDLFKNTTQTINPFTHRLL